MNFISHRGNLYGKNPTRENTHQHIFNALSEGFDCEVDVWFENDNFYLGHDEPQYKTSLRFLENPGLWIHAKNIEALNELLRYEHLNCFWHETDKYTITSKKYIWAYPGSKPSNSNSVCLLPEQTEQSVDGFDYVCSDFVGQFRDGFKC